MDFQLKLLYDGNCPFCVREIALLRRLDKNHLLAFENIAAAEFDPARYGLCAREVQAFIHGVLPTGDIVCGLEVFRRAYSAVGWGWLLAPTAWPGLRFVCDGAYRLFARHRVRLGRLFGCRCDGAGGGSNCTPQA